MSECKICKNKFSSTSYLKSHMKRVHLENEINEICGICDRAFPTNDLLEKHMNTNHKDKSNFQCDFCLKYLATKSGLSLFTSNKKRSMFHNIYIQIKYGTPHEKKAHFRSKELHL